MEVGPSKDGQLCYTRAPFHNVFTCFDSDILPISRPKISLSSIVCALFQKWITLTCDGGVWERVCYRLRQVEQKEMSPGQTDINVAWQYNKNGKLVTFSQE